MNNKTPKLLTISTTLAFIFIFAMTALDVILSFLGWKPTFGDDLLAGVIGFLPSVGSVSLSMLIGITHSWKTKVISSLIWFCCIAISLTGNFLNMTARAFESLESEVIAKVEVTNVKDNNKIQIDEYKKSNELKISSFKLATSEQLSIFDKEISDLNIQYEAARDARDHQINDGVNSDGSMGPKARAFQAAMDNIAKEIENKREIKREFQLKATNDLLQLQSDLSRDLIQFQEETSSKQSKANIELAEAQNDMRGHMPVVRYFLPNKDHQRSVVLWGLGLFAAVISLTGPLISYALAIHLNHKKLLIKEYKRKPKNNDNNVPEEVYNIIEEEESLEEDVVESEVVDNASDTTADDLKKKREVKRKKNLGYR